MKLTFLEGGIIAIDDAQVIFKNFGGAGTKYNREGDRNFAIRFDDPELAEMLQEKGVNVKLRQPDGGDAYYFVKVKVNFNGFRPPMVYLSNGKNRIILNEETISELDICDVIKWDMDIKMSHWEMNGKDGFSLYLDSMEALKRVDRFAARWAEEESPEE